MPSTADLQSGGLGLAPTPSALRRLIAVDTGEFAEQYWGRQALLSRAAELSQPFADLLDESAIDELVSERGLRTPFLRVARNGTTLADRAFTASAGVGATIADQVSDDKLVRLFAEGSTMVLQALHRVWPPILRFCSDLSADLGHPVQANAYVTPPQNQGFSTHYDVHDVFVLQIAGEKEWTIHTPVHPAPLRDQPWTDRRATVERRAAEPPLLREVLRPGDCLYLPRGFLHAARARGGVSTHLTIGIHTWTGHAIAEQILQQALASLARDESVRRSLPLGVPFTDPDALQDEVERIRAAVQAAVDRITPANLQPSLLSTVRNAQRAGPIGPLRQLRVADDLVPTDMLRLRPQLAAILEPRPSGGVLRSRAGDFVLADFELAAVNALLDQGMITADELGLDLSRRMILASLVLAE